MPFTLVSLAFRVCVCACVRGLKGNVLPTRIRAIFTAGPAFLLSLYANIFPQWTRPSSTSFLNPMRTKSQSRRDKVEGSRESARQDRVLYNTEKERQQKRERQKQIQIKVTMPAAATCVALSSEHTRNNSAPGSRRGRVLKYRRDGNGREVDVCEARPKSDDEQHRRV